MASMMHTTLPFSTKSPTRTKGSASGLGALKNVPTIGEVTKKTSLASEGAGVPAGGDGTGPSAASWLGWTWAPGDDPPALVDLLILRRTPDRSTSSSAMSSFDATISISSLSSLKFITVGKV